MDGLSAPTPSLTLSDLAGGAAVGIWSIEVNPSGEG